MGVRLTTYLHLVPRLRMRGAIPPFTTSVRGVLLRMGYVYMVWYLVKHRVSLPFTF